MYRAPARLALDPPPTVRLLTPKHARPGATVVKSKGCAFLEFSTRSTLQAALRLHQSELDGRRINVELTAGGGGKGDTRLAKVKARNKLLTAQRVCPFPISPSPLFLSLACNGHSSTSLPHRRGGSSSRRQRREWIPCSTKPYSHNASRRHQGKARCHSQNALGPSMMGFMTVSIVEEQRQERNVAHGQKASALA